MIRVNVSKDNILISKADFSTEELAEAWVASQVAAKTFGYPARWVSSDQLGELDPNDAIETATVPNPLGGAELTLYKFAAEYEIEYVDVTSEYEDLALKAESVEAINLGADLIADIRTLNKKKLADASFTSEEFTALLQNATAAAIERALWNGSFETGKALIQGFSGYYSDQEKAPLIAKIDAFLLKYP